VDGRLLAGPLDPRARRTAHLAQPGARAARRGAVGRVARRTRGPEVHPRDAGGAELEAGGAERLRVDPGEQPPRRREVGRIAAVGVAIEEHVRRSGRAGQEPGLGARILRAHGQRARAVRGQAPELGGAGARQGAEGAIAGAVRERVEREDDAGLAHAEPVVGDTP